MDNSYFTSKCCKIFCFVTSRIAASDNYNFTITYKRRRLVDFNVRRRKDAEHDYVIKSVEVDKDFVDTETQIKVIHNEYVNYAKKDRCYINLHRNLNDLRELFRLVRNANPNMSAIDLWSFIYDLHNDFWLVEEIETNGEETL